MNFKKLALVASLVTFGLVGCASHPTPVAVNNPPPPPVETAAPVTTPPPAPVASAPPADPLLASGDGWSLKVPNDSWELADADELSDGVLVRADNDSLKARAMLMSNDFPSPSAMFPVVVIKSVTSDGGKVVKSGTSTINGNQFNWADVNMTSGKLTVHVRVWMLAKNGKGFALICGTPTTNPKVVAECQQMANTLEIK